MNAGPLRTRHAALTSFVLAFATAPLAAQTPAPTLVTRWAAEIDTAHVLPEYPRPQMVRPSWQNLNGWWDYAVQDSSAPRPRSWQGRILVPFPIESQLSLVRRPVSETERLWYHRTFRATTSFSGRVLLHFGAVDWDTEVFVNGRSVGSHRGGYDPFTFDITDALRPTGDQELVVSVWDPTDAGEQPRGKQVRRPHGILYTSVTGIWQTVWLEPVPAAYITRMDIIPDVDSSRVAIRVTAAGAQMGTRVHVAVRSGENVVATAQGPVADTLTLTIPNAHLWSPEDPFLYDLTVALESGDSISSYFGMRKIAVGRDSLGVLRLFLNNRPLFQFGPLDQGYWPDGLYTAPTDEALRSDIETTRGLGFNMARKHVKVEPARWYYHADRLGLLVWQDMPSGANRTPAARAEFGEELQHVVDALKNHPAIVMWVPFNEGWGQHETGRYTTWLQAYDPSRLVNSASGWTDRGTGDVSDLHAYPGPTIPANDERRVRVLGEFGGLGLPLEGHTWLDSDNWGYRTFTDRSALGDAYRGLIAQVRYLIGDGLSAAVYTQTTDVEIEVNGVVTYDRAIVKLPSDAAEINQRLYAPPPIVRGVVATSRAEGQPWRYTTAMPSDEWMQPDFDDTAWQDGLGGFGHTSDTGTHVRTVWTTDDLWLRRTFELSEAELVAPQLIVRHDDDAEIFINGELAARLEGSNQTYTLHSLPDAVRRLLRPGPNTLAVHVKNTRGAQYVDAGLVEVLEPGTP